MIFARTDELKKQLAKKTSGSKLSPVSDQNMLFSLFYEPSTRTRMSFSAAAQHFGMQVVSTENAKEFSSAIKGETIEDTVRVLCEYKPDAIVMRHYEAGAAEAAAKVSTVPIINAGDGAGQHPTQALLDMYTICNEIGRCDNLRVVIGGDLKHGRTVRSLSYLLTKYPNNSITYVSPKELKIGSDIKSYLKKHAISFVQTDEIEEALKDADVIYWTRVQKERFDSTKLKLTYKLDETHLKLMKSNAIILHPLPRVDEIATSVDADPRAAYFRQAGNGMYVRMALIEWCLGYLGESK